MKFSLGLYLRSHIFAIAFGLVAIAITVAIFGLFGTGLDAQIYVATILLAGFIIPGIVDYFRWRGFYENLQAVFQASPQGHLLMSLVESSSDPEAQLIVDLLNELSTRYDAELASEKRDNADYRHYVELWVHEVKTPLAAAQLMLSGRPGAQDAELALELERVESAVEQALYYARSLSLSNDYTIKPVVLRSVVAEAYKKNARYLINKEVTPRVDIDADLTVLADPLWITFILSQLVINAATYGASEIWAQAQVEDEGSPEGRTVLTLSDNGMGIPLEDLPRVFDRGFTGSNGRKLGSSTGMGLYLCSTMASRMGIGLDVTSTPGSGTTFCLTFPHDRRRLQWSETLQQRKVSVREIDGY